MARINIEEQWWSDPRRSKLARILASEDMADARAIRMWRLAQEFWQHERSLVPLKIFSTLEAWEALLECHLAEVRGEEVYVSGSSQYLDWVFEEKQKRKRGGKKSAKRPRDAKGRLLPANHPAEVQVTSKCDPSEPSNVQVSGSGSGSSSSSKAAGNLKKQEARFRYAKDVVKVRPILAGMFPGQLPKDLERRIPEMIAYCGGDPAQVCAELEELYQNPKVRTGEGVAGSRSSYTYVAIKKHFGLTEGEP